MLPPLVQPARRALDCDGRRRNDPARHWLMKKRDDVALVRDGAVWVIARVTIDNVWRSGGPAVLAGV